MPSRWSKTPDTKMNAVVGAAKQIHLDRRAEVERTRERGTAEWQRIAWHHYDSIGEIKYAFNYFAAVASRVRLFAGYMDEDSDTPAPLGQQNEVERSFVTAARYELDKLNGGVGGQPNMIRQMALNLNVSGEVYLVGSHDSWTARSTSELQFDPEGRPILRTSRLHPVRHLQTLDKDKTFVARIWRTHPEYSDDADSSMKGVENDCEELLQLSRVIRASAQSRMNAGILFVADELRFQRMHDDGEDPDPDTDPFEEELLLAVTDPIGKSDSPSEVVPMMVRAPAALADNAIKHISFGRDFDENIINRHEKTLQRVLNGLEIPKDIITGLANVRYSNARQITEDMYKAHVEPMMVMICEALTTVFLRPRMRARGYSEERVKRLHVWYDPSEVVVKPDRSEDADKGYERLLISGSAWRRAHGFSDTDAPSSEELVRRIALGGTVAPATTLEFLRAVAPDFVKHAEKLANDAFTDTAIPPAASPAPMAGEGGDSGDSAPIDSPPAGSEADANETPGGTGGPSEPPNMGNVPSQPDAASVMEALRKLTIDMPGGSDELAGGTGSPELVDRERRLARALDVERRSRESIHSYLTDAMDSALRRAGARTVSKVRGDNELKSMISSVAMSETFATIPERDRERFGLEAEKLVRDTLTDARAGFISRMSTVLRQGWRALGEHVYDKLWPDHLSDVEKAWDWLLPKLIDRAASKLRNPKSVAQNVSMDMVREASARAGGRGEDETVAPASGRAVLSDKAIQATGWEFGNKYTWVYGVTDNGFTPHERLDGLVFDSWFADALASPDGQDNFPFTSHMYPGDHDGCRCDALPIPLDPMRNMDKTVISGVEDARTPAEPAANGFIRR